MADAIPFPAPIVDSPSTSIATPTATSAASTAPAVPAVKKGPTSAATQLVNLISKNETKLFHDSQNRPYATVTIGTHCETMSLEGDTFANYLSREYYLAKKKAVNGSAIKDASRILIGSALHRGPQHDVFTRLARVGDTIWLDLVNPEWTAIKITPDGWSVDPAPDVKFRRPHGLMPLPIPVRGESTLKEMLTALINIKDPMLMIAWLVGAMRGRKPYPILAIDGEQGTAKTSAQRFLRRLIDPNVADLRITPKEPRDLMIAALNSHIIAYDNLSVIPDWLSDALCMLSTGGGFSTRELFSDMNEVLFKAERPIMFNGINGVVTRPDLLNRALVLTLDVIQEEHRRSESDLDAAFDASHPAILAALLDAVVSALKNETSTKIARLPRMADFARWIVAAAPSLGWDADVFLDSYRENQQAAIESVLDGDVVVDTIRSLPAFDTTGSWTGQLKDLLNQIPDHKHKPQSPRGLLNALRRKAPALRQIGITMEFVRGHVRTVTFSRDAIRESESDAHFADADTESAGLSDDLGY